MIAGCSAASGAARLRQRRSLSSRRAIGIVEGITARAQQEDDSNELKERDDQRQRDPARLAEIVKALCRQRELRPGEEKQDGKNGKEQRRIRPWRSPLCKIE